MKVITIKQRLNSLSEALGYTKATYTESDGGAKKPLEPHATIKGAFVGSTIRKGPDGRWLTGIDPQSGKIRSIRNAEERSKQEHEAQDNLNRLEILTGKRLDATNDQFWGSFAIRLLPTYGELKFNLDNPLHELQYRACMASGLIAPSFDDLAQDKYEKTSFYVYNSDEEKSKQKTNKLHRESIKSILINYKTNKERLYYIAKTLEAVSNRSMDADDLLLVLLNTVESTPVSKLDQLEAVISRDPKELQIHVTIAEAIERGVLKYNGALKAYMFAGKNVGKTKDQAVQYFSEKEKEDLFVQLQEIMEEMK